MQILEPLRLLFLIILAYISYRQIPQIPQIAYESSDDEDFLEEESQHVQEVPMEKSRDEMIEEVQLDGVDNNSQQRGEVVGSIEEGVRGVESDNVNQGSNKEVNTDTLISSEDVLNEIQENGEESTANKPSIFKTKRIKKHEKDGKRSLSRENQGDVENFREEVQNIPVA